MTNRLYLGILQKGGVESPRLHALQIIDDATFQRVQEIRAARSGTNTADTADIPLQTKGKALLSGFLYCAHCGARVNSTVHRKEYRCNANIDGVAVNCGGPKTYRAEPIEGAFQTVILALLTQLEALTPETILEYKYQIALSAQRQELERVRSGLQERHRDQEALQGEIAKSLRGESKFDLSLLQSLLEETAQRIEVAAVQRYQLESRLQNAQQLRREIAVKQAKYCGLTQALIEGAMEERKMLLSNLIRRVEVREGYELKIVLSPGFEQFLEGLLGTR